jgi:geranylgeranyl pyrophosphate synthase
MGLKDIYRPISKELALVEQEIQRQINLIADGQNLKNKRFIERVLSYLFEVPGKLLRPALVLLSGRAVDDQSQPNIEELIKLATAVEFLHSASLIHDDIIDESEYRRHQLTLNKQFGNQIAVLVGDLFYSQFFSILINLNTASKAQHERLLRVFSSTTKRLCFGEIYEHKMRIDGEAASFGDYLEILENKTASLFSVSCMSGGLLYMAKEHVTSALANYGLYLGFAFQIVDDLLDNDSIFNSDTSIIKKAQEYAEMAKAESGITYYRL